MLSDHEFELIDARRQFFATGSRSSPAAAMNPNGDLLEACRKGQVRRAARALKKGAHPNAAADQFGWTPLMSAATQGNRELVELLLEAGADVATKSVHGATALGVAECRTSEIVNALVAAGGDIKKTSLNNIARRGNIALLTTVLEAGVSVDPPGKRKTSALITAAENGHLGMVELLVEGYGAKVNYAYSHQTPLSSASHRGHVEVVRFLLGAGARPDQGGASSLHNAAGAAHLEAVELLLEAGADVQQVGYMGWTPLIAAVHVGQEPERVELVRRLLDAGAEPHHKADEGMTALHFAAQRMVVPVAELLLAAGADLGARNDDGVTPLELTAAAESLDLGRRGVVRTPTRVGNDDYYEVCVFLLDCERQAGQLTAERLDTLIELSSKRRCPQFVGLLRDLRAETC